jgi:DMSO/TMAO reductase YedYZ molybdopterin-dependent catalytic subunit
MSASIGRFRFSKTFAVALAICSCAAARAQGTTTPPAASAQLVIGGDVKTPLSLSLADLKVEPRTTVQVADEHQAGKKEVFEGVSLAALLKQAGAPQLRGATMPTYVLMEAADGYRVIFSLAELDSEFQDSEVMVADTMDGAPLGEKVGPLRLIVPHDKRPARSVRMLESIKVVTLPK